MNARLDHLVVMADTLAQGVAWCEATLGVTPAPGGQHPLFGTHNRLLAIGTPRYPGAYLELIAIDPGAAGADEARRTRWFDMDDAALRERVRRHGPQLIHWVARVPDVAQSCAALARLGIDRGEILQASRLTPRGLLQWRIAVRADGRRLFDGGLPTLIQWGAVHPADSLPASGVSLRALRLGHPDAATLTHALARLGLGDVATTASAEPSLHAELLTPRGPVRI